MLHTAETRWFFPETLPDSVLTWFRAGQALDSEGVQVHEYLMFPGCNSVGVKLREGRLEIKAMRGTSRPLNLDPGVHGRIEQWVKWSFAGDGLQALDAALHQAGRWMKVRKERFLRKFSAEGKSLVEVSARVKPLPAIGCNIELTRIEVDADPRFWFSLGFEAFGPSGVTVTILGDAIHLYFTERGLVPRIPLNECDSFGYPAWLAKF